MKRPATWDKLLLVEVVWEDAVLDQDANGDLDQPATADKFGGMRTCSDVGYLIRKDRKVIVLAVGVCRADQTYRHANTIPRGWVKQIIYLQRPEAPNATNPPSD